jgi:Trypsin
MRTGRTRLLGSGVVAGTVVLVVAGGALALRGGATASAAVESYRLGTSGAGDTASYWTSGRIAAATPDVGTGTGTALRQSRALGSAQIFAGSPVLGILLYNDGRTDHYCTGSVINSQKRNLVLTAAHCLYSSGGFRRNVAFVPKYYAGKEPYGLWTAKVLVVDHRWKSSYDMDLDFGFVALNSRGGKQIGDVVGSNQLWIGQGYRKWVDVMGYPSSGSRPIFCGGWTKKKFTYQIEFDCHGYYGGTSGSPWVVGYDARTGTGGVMGVIGGYQRGGISDYISYSPTFDKDVWNLRIAANAKA